MTGQFYISNDDEDDVQKCKGSREFSNVHYDHGTNDRWVH